MKQILDYSNLFFFVKANHVQTECGPTDDTHTGEIRLVCPPQQRKELSQFYHRHQANTCPWHLPENKCKISGMEKCLLSPFWGNAPPEDESDTDILLKHYAPLWEKLSAPSCSKSAKSGMAFRSSSILFDRRQRYILEDGNKGRVTGSTQRDKIAACITYRMIMPVQEGENPEDQVPQVMFVPIYAGSTPFVVAATVVNAQLPEPLNSSLSEWRRSYRFAGMVFQFMANRLKETARKAYLNKAADLVQETHRLCQNDLYENQGKYANIESCFVQCINQKLNELAKIYPYHKIGVAPAGKTVNNRDRLDVFETPEGEFFSVTLTPNTHWLNYSDKQFFTEKQVAKKFRSAIARNVVINELEENAYLRFVHWCKRRFGSEPLTRKGWRETAKKLDWDGTDGS